MLRRTVSQMKPSAFNWAYITYHDALTGKIWNFHETLSTEKQLPRPRACNLISLPYSLESKEAFKDANIFVQRHYSQTSLCCRSQNNATCKPNLKSFYLLQSDLSLAWDPQRMVEQLPWHQGEKLSMKKFLWGKSTIQKFLSEVATEIEHSDGTSQN